MYQWVRASLNMFIIVVCTAVWLLTMHPAGQDYQIWPVCQYPLGQSFVIVETSVLDLLRVLLPRCKETVFDEVEVIRGDKRLGAFCSLHSIGLFSVHCHFDDCPLYGTGSAVIYQSLKIGAIA